MKSSIPYRLVIALLDTHIRKTLELVGQEAFSNVRGGYLASTYWCSIPEKFVSVGPAPLQMGLTTCDWCVNWPYLPVSILNIVHVSILTAVSFTVAPSSKQPPSPPIMIWIFCGAMTQQNVRQENK